MFRTILLIVILSAVASAQQSLSSEWAGEWGAFSPQPSKAGVARYLGQSIQISDCLGTSCHFEVACEGVGAHCNGTGQISVTGPTSATATLKAAAQTCTLDLALSATGAGKTILLKKESGDCNSFCTPTGKFTGPFLFRTHGTYYGADLQSCYYDFSKARAAICENPSLADTEKTWINLLDDSNALKRATSNARRQVIDQEQSCDSQTDVRSCLSSLAQASIRDLSREKAALIESLTKPGDPAQAAKQIAAIAGSYRRSFANADVQGDKFQSTDELDIKQSSATSISYTAHLEFYNGHQCEDQGIAEFKQAGLFVRRGEAEAKACYFEIIPKATGVELADPTGQCRLQNCGARGGWNAASFSFADRLKK